LLDGLVYEVEITLVALAAEPRDLHEDELEIFEQRAQLGILRGWRIHQQSGGDKEVRGFPSEDSVGLRASTLIWK
jgi:hypothetical protein